jgi:hypothetical protein
MAGFNPVTSFSVRCSSLAIWDAPKGIQPKTGLQALSSRLRPCSPHEHTDERIAARFGTLEEAALNYVFWPLLPISDG